MKKFKLIREQLYEMIGHPVTPEQIKNFNEVYNKCVDEYKQKGKMPADMVKEFEKALLKEANA